MIKRIPFSEVREYYQRMQPDGHWFDPKTKKFFGSRLPAYAYQGDGGMLFISSELDFRGERRYYNVRRQKVSGAIENVGTFNACRTRAEAFNLLKNTHQGK